MQLEISYRTTFEFEPAVVGGTTALRLRPRPRIGLDVLESTVSADPGTIAMTYTDAWGTIVDVAETVGSHATASFTTTARVATTPPEFEEPLRADELHLYTSDSARVRMAAVDAIGGWTLAGVGDSWAAVESALGWMPQRFSFQAGSTGAATPIEDVLRLGHGDCQDFAHVFLALLRRWGWAARYVSGYLFSETSQGMPRIEGDAMHAWVEAYRPGRGWIGLDATAGGYTDDRYVPVGHGRDHEDVRPIRGVLRGRTAQNQSARLVMSRSPQ